LLIQKKTNHKISKATHNKKGQYIPNEIREEISPLEKLCNKVEIVTQHDDFDNTTETYLNIFSDQYRRYLPMYLCPDSRELENSHIGIGFYIFNSSLFLEITVYGISGMGVATGDSISFLFEDTNRLDFVFNSKRIGHSYIKINSILINESQLKTFINYTLLKWKLTSTRRGIYKVGDNKCFYKLSEIQDRKTFQKMLKYTAKLIYEEFK
jgi:hypothetical protein